MQRPNKIATKYKRLAILAIAATLLGYGFYLFNFKNSALKTFNNLQRESASLKDSLKNGDLKNLQEFLRLADKETASISEKANTFGVPSIFFALDIVKPGLKKTSESLNLVASLAHNSSNIAEDLNELIDNGPKYFFAGQGVEIIKLIENIRKNLADSEPQIIKLNSLIRQWKKLSPGLASIGSQLEQNYLPAIIFLDRSKEFLDGLSALLQKPGGSNIALIFQNPTEIRPAGGFIGSYGVLSIKEGGMHNLFVDDIYNADRQLVVEKTPPKELQLITSRWGARDANWFFDFPVSARKVSEFLESSKMFRDAGTKFDGVIAINTNVLKSLIEVAGPIRLADYKLTITSENFLAEIQREVESGRDKKPGQNPKKILSALTPILMEKLQNLDDAGKSQLQKSLIGHLDQKDIQIYFQDNRIENMALAYNLAGAVFQLPREFLGDYLAVVNANIGGGKTDAFITQNIRLKTRINSGGAGENELQITRKHSGQNQKDWWYKIANKNYLKVLAPRGSRLKSIRGNSQAPKMSNVQPELDSPLTDPDLWDIEYESELIGNSGIIGGKESGKNYFGFWMETKPGQTKTVTLTYETPPMQLQNGKTYEFIFEKQSGVDSFLEYSITAPDGYAWKESGNAEFKLKTDNPSGLIKISLTLEQKG